TGDAAATSGAARSGGETAAASGAARAAAKTTATARRQSADQRGRDQEEGGPGVSHVRESGSLTYRAVQRLERAASGAVGSFAIGSAGSLKSRGSEHRRA